MTATWLRDYREIWLVDFEFHQPAGEPPQPLCMVAREFHSGHVKRCWADSLVNASRPPFSIGEDCLFVAYYASAELGCFEVLGWRTPARILDLFTEFRCLTNGTSVPCGNGLLGALAYYGLGAIEATEKESMRQLAMRGGTYSTEEREALLDYCQSDVDALARLLPLMADRIDLPRALLRGRYMAAVAHMETVGVPIDVALLDSLRRNWTRIKGRLTAEIDRDYSVFVPSGDDTLNPSSKYGAEVLERATEIGCHPYYLDQAVREVLDRRSHEREIVEAETVARQRTGLSINRIREWEGKGRDHSTWRGLDVQARALASEFPQLGIGSGYTAESNYDDADYAGRLWDRLRRPTLKPANRLDAEVLDEAASLAIDAPASAPDHVSLTFSARRFADWLVRTGIPWPRLASGALALDDDTFRQMARSYPAVSPLRELRHALGEMRLFEDLAVGSDGRNRCLLSPFRATSGRNAPSNSRFIFGPSVWLRGLIRPAPGYAVAYLDWSQQEFGIAAALSGDRAMMEAYSSGDPYLTFAKQAGAVPPDGTKKSHPQERELFKVCALAVQYGMGAESLAKSLDQPTAVARELLRLHRSTYPVFWSWNDAAVSHAMLYGWLQTVFGWRVHVGPRANPRSLGNFPMQANGAEMLRLACSLATERGVRVCAPVHDALLIEGPEDDIEATVQITQDCMREASRVVLDGFELRSDAAIVRWPERYSDPRGQRMWETVSRLLAEISQPAEVGVGDEF